jgi:hypothetical protein
MPPRKKAVKNPEATSQPEQVQQPVAIDCMQAFIFYFFADCSCN